METYLLNTLARQFVVHVFFSRKHVFTRVSKRNGNKRRVPTCQHVYTYVRQDYLPDRFGSETHDDGGGQGATAVQEQLPLLQDHGGEGGLPGFLQGFVGEPHQGNGDVDIAGDVRRGSGSLGHALRPIAAVGALEANI